MIRWRRVEEVADAVGHSPSGGATFAALAEGGRTKRIGVLPIKEDCDV